MRTVMLVACAGALACLAAGPLGAQAPRGATDPDVPVQARIDAIRQAAPAVTLDGFGDDWAAIPTIPDAPGDAGGDPSRDIRGVAVLPLGDVLIVRVDTRGSPSRDDRAFWLNLDVHGTRVAELQVGLSPDGNHFVRRFDGAGNAQAIRRVRFPWAVGEVVEVAFPYAVLEAVLGDSVDLDGAQARSWMRAVAFTWNRATGAFTDFASAASYRIVADPGPLDAPLRQPAVDPVVLDFPLADLWMVSQGAFGPGSHGEIWAYDFSKADEGLRWSAPENTCENDDFWSWDEPVSSPASGRVVRAVVDLPDERPCGSPGAGAGNEIYIDGGGDVGIWMAHFRQGTVAVEAGAQVAAGRFLGRVGNSGRSTGPHLHLGTYRLSDGTTTLPVAFRDVLVGLNPVPDDPWARRVAVWSPRGGMFVSR